MPHAFAQIAFTPRVKAEQQRDGSRASYARSFEADAQTFNDRLGQAETEFLAQLRSFYMATVSETGWPYVQHRGGPAGFVQVLDDQHIAFADYAGNRQLISVGNLAGNDRVALIAVDYVHRVRLKLLGTMAVRPLADDAALAARLATPGNRARPQRAMVVTVEGFDWNCPQHIPLRLDAEDVQRALDERDARIADLESRLKALQRQPQD
ncbi:Pyridoxamine 5'-phosphate oxidase [Rubrivivax sp. A210]|uniref:pyridoxamine 5'-phosphate oxidase family protein n=1 Tax=Rubrivivax sp. A210 TaxID=2772301 RepID=UPI00191A5BA8|nr:pyridoxamine 5'-phosphate oxidase family protein [Rubrivivax sp. A210]CAD5371073.1 Pyridoxamine 5'-phosphate oxidase [Rubrivivax sp. A210]